MKKRIFKIDVENKKSGKIFSLILGDSYKSFEEHLQDIVSIYTEKWLYVDTQKGKCLGRKLEINILGIYESKDKFVSFGGLKACPSKVYDKEVEKHNKHSKGKDKCKPLKYIDFIKKSQKYMNNILSKLRIIENVSICPTFKEER